MFTLSSPCARLNLAPSVSQSCLFLGNPFHHVCASPRLRLTAAAAAAATSHHVAAWPRSFHHFCTTVTSTCRGQSCREPRGGQRARQPLVGGRQGRRRQRQQTGRWLGWAGLWSREEWCGHPKLYTHLTNTIASILT
ncbi:hypothetical protein E2C01_093115 [Portunus trituberculatus]|uniref:Uncharacterized protein n=1 Tax=Portunus trituberculatus TaxID=210409 RepID=A0A5B7JTN7_PORTR|nr:hypothetical protein [Portunus trituberculatus]